jgi:uncharacterized protein (TIGR03435 family)
MTGDPRLHLIAGTSRGHRDGERLRGGPFGSGKIKLIPFPAGLAYKMAWSLLSHCLHGHRCLSVTLPMRPRNAIGWAMCAFLPSQAQPAPRALEVASIKPHDPRSTPTRSLFYNGRSLRGDATAVGLISMAYGIERYQISGIPGWADDQFYDIAATADGPAAITRDQFLDLLRQLLADRFQFKFHRETKDLPVYALIADKRGPTMKRSAPDAQYHWGVGRGQWNVTRVSMAQFARSLAREVGRTVVDLTGIAGNYDFKLEWTPESTETTPEAGPSIFTALQEQLGLRLESRKLPIEILVVDRVDKPSEN